MKWYGYFALVLSTVGFASAASAVEPGEWTQQEASSRRTAGQAVAHVARMTTEPFYNNAYNGSANMAPGFLGWGMGGGGYGGSYGHGGHGAARDLSGWGNCDCSPPCTSHLWGGLPPKAAAMRLSAAALPWLHDLRPHLHHALQHLP